MVFSKFYRFFFCLVLVLSGSAQASAPANLDPSPDAIRQKAWPDWMQYRLHQGTEAASTVIFNAMEDVNILGMDIGKGSMDVEVGREVYDNHDAIQTFSVVDHFNFKFQVPIIDGTLLEGKIPITWSLGSQEGLSLVNLRQSRSRDVSAFFTDFDQMLKTAQSWYNDHHSVFERPSQPKNHVVLAAPVAPTARSQDADSGWFISDPLRKAEFTKLLNFVTFPVRIPFKADWLKSLETGEIMSYSASGTVSLSLNVGWNLDPTSVTRIITAGASISTYLNGNYRVTVLKEDDRFVRVKLTRAYSRGTGQSVGTGAEQRLINGFLISRIKPKLEIIPFRFSADQSVGRSFDVGYRYDMNNPMARDAYERAMLGSFVESAELAEKGDGSLEQSPVERVFDRSSSNSRDSVNTKVRLSIFFNHTRGSTTTVSDAKITFPDGSYNLLQAVTDNAHDTNVLFWDRSKFDYRYTVIFDKDGYQGGKPNSFRLIAEGSLEDSNTSSQELYEYMGMVEALVGQSGIFPRPPKVRPVTDETLQVRPAKGEPVKVADGFLIGSRIPYGRSAFYYRLTLSQEQTMKFINTPEEKIWPILEKAFEVDEGDWSSYSARLYYMLTHDVADAASMSWISKGSFIPTPGSLTRLLCAQTFAGEWMDLHKAKGPTELAKGVAELFSGTLYSYELMRALRIALADESIGFVVNGSNRSFGYIWDEKDVIADNTVFERVAKVIDFDQPWVYPVQDKEADISNINIAVLSEHKLVIQFYSKSAPQFIYFRLDKMGLFDNPILSELTLHNRDGKFQQGLNEITLDWDHSGLDRSILEKMEPGLQYRVSLAASRDGSNWGLRRDTKFRYTWDDAGLRLR